MVKVNSFDALRQQFFTTMLIGASLLFQEGDCRALYTTGIGSVTETKVTHFEFIQRLGNPCGIERQESNSNIPTAETFNRKLFYESMIIAIDQGLRKINLLRSSDPSLPECKGINLESLPSTPSFENITEAQLFKEIYNSQIFLTSHFHIMGLDRQMTIFGLNDVQDEDIDEHDNIPSWRMLRCGSESESFFPRLEEVTIQMEEILCTLVSSANLEQRASFREPFNRLVNTTFFRYHSSCSTLQTRDCLVLRQATNTLSLLSAKFNKLLNPPVLVVGVEEGRNNGPSYEFSGTNKID